MTTKRKFNFPADAHDIVMIARTGIEFVVFVFFIYFAPSISLFFGFPQLAGLQYGVSAALFFSVIFLALTVIQRIKNEPIKLITYFESVIDAVLIIWLIFIFGGMNGPFFFFFFLAIMEAAFTFNIWVVLAVILMGIFSTVGEYIFQLYVTSFESLNILSSFILFFRLVTISLIGYYSHSFLTSVKKEQKTARKLRLAYEELKKLDRAKSEFVSIASHQLRTPLTAIKGYISMMLEKIYGDPPQKMKKPLENIYASNERLIRLVNDLLNVSRIEAGRMKVEKEKVAIENIVFSVIEELKNTVKEKGIYLKTEKSQKALPQVSIDRNKIRQVIMNLIDNAIRYTNKGGITVGIKNSESVSAQAGKIQIIIKDTGEGMTKEEINHLFESFSRGKAGTRFWTEGAGLGLYVAKKFVDMHNGKIWAESPGKEKGSTFYIELPIK